MSHSQLGLAVKVNTGSLGPELLFPRMMLFENCSNNFRSSPPNLAFDDIRMLVMGRQLVGRWSLLNWGLNTLNKQYQPVYMHTYVLSWWLNGKESTCQFRRLRFDLWVTKIPWRRKWQPTVGFLPGKSHGQRSLVGHNPWGGKSQTRLSN